MNFKNALELLKDKFQSWFESLILILPNLLIAIVITVVFYHVSKLVRKGIEKLLKRIIQNKALVSFLGTLTQTAVILLGFLVAIKIMKLDEALFSILAGVGIAGLAIGFAFQDVASNFIAGIALVFRKDYPFKVGDIVQTNDYLGTVKEINLRDTRIETFQGQSIFIPNKVIFENAVENFSLLNQRRVDLTVGVSYADDLQKAEDLAVEAVSSLEARLKEKDVELFYESFGDSSINFQIRFWIKFSKQPDFLKARSEAIKAIKASFDQNDITIPFPIRTLDFGIKGGETLSAMMTDGKTKSAKGDT